jgi:hypothetical protein
MTKFPKSGQTNKWEGMYEFAKAIYDTITFDYSRDKEMRSEFTKKIVEEAWDQCDKDEVSGFIITCTNYQCNDYACKTEIQFSDGIWFDLLCFSGDRESYYHHKGDGGYLNWAIVGGPFGSNFDKDGSNVYFHKTLYYRTGQKQYEDDNNFDGWIGNTDEGRG